MATRYFTLEQARALLPRVRSSMGQALQLHRHLRAAVAALGEAGHEVDWALLRGEQQLDERADERATRALARARMIYMALRESVGEIEALGVEVKSVMNGLIDFPSWCDGEREVLLCYQLGEPDLEYFHDMHEGFAARRSVAGHEFFSEFDESRVEPLPDAHELPEPQRQ